MELERPVLAVTEGDKMGTLKAALVFLGAMLIPEAHPVVEDIALRWATRMAKRSAILASVPSSTFGEHDREYPWNASPRNRKGVST